MKVLLLLCTLMAGLESAKAQTQTTFTKWKQVQDPSELATDDVVVIVDLTTSSAMRNNPKYDEGKTVSNEAPASVKVTLKEELDRITSEVADTIIWKADRTDDKYAFLVESKTHYLFNSDQNLRVGYVGSNDAWKRKFDLDKGLLYMGNVETGPSEYKNYHVGLKIASGIMDMMKGNTWELTVDADGGVSSEIAATKMAFFKKVVTTKPGPTLSFPKHDYEADVKNAGSFESPMATVAETGAGSITYYSGNTDLAEVDASTGAVTVKKRGTVRIYAQISATDSYDDYLTSYVLRIDDSDAVGGRNHPFTVAEAIAYAKAAGHEEETANGVYYFVKGIVSSVGGAMAGMEGMEDMMDMMMDMIGGMGGTESMGGFDISSLLSMFMGEQEPGTLTYAISDNGVNRDSLSINNGRGLQLADLTDNDISVGDEVTVYGPLAYTEDNDMMSMFGSFGQGGGNEGGDESSQGGGEAKDKRTVKMPRVNYLREHERNLITKDITLYYGQTKETKDLFSITNMYNGTLVTNTNPNPRNGDLKDKTLTLTSLKLSDTDVASWVVNSEKTDSLLTPKKSGIITVTVNAPVLLQSGDTIYMKRKFNLDVRDRQVLPAGTMIGNYELVTDASQLKANDKLLIVATIDNKPKVLNRNASVSGSSDSSNPLASLLGGGSNGSNITIDADGKISQVPDDALILTLEQADSKWLLQTGRTADYKMTYLYISDTDGGSTSMIPGMGSSGAKLKTGLLTGTGAAGDSCKVSFTFPEGKEDSVQIQFNFADRVNGENTIIAKNVIRFEKGMMSSSFAGFEPASDKATLPRLYRLVQAEEYSITVGEALWATVISSYDVTLPEGLTGYVVKEIDNVNNQAILQDVTAQGGLKGGEPYLVNAASAGAYTLTKAKSDNAVAKPEINLLEISNGETGNGIYVLADKGEGAGFYKWTGGLLGAGRVYLQKTVSGAARAFIPFGFDNDETTGIDASATIKGNRGNDNVVYDLQGRRVDESRLPKGIYIVNGKKFVVK